MNEKQKPQTMGIGQMICNNYGENSKQIVIGAKMPITINITDSGIKIETNDNSKSIPSRP